MKNVQAMIAKNRILLLVIIVVALGALTFFKLSNQESTPASSDTKVETPKEVTKLRISTRTRFYHESNAASGIVGSFPANVTVDVVDSTDGWYRVSYNGLTGWIQNANVTPLAE